MMHVPRRFWRQHMQELRSYDGYIYLSAITTYPTPKILFLPPMPEAATATASDWLHCPSATGSKYFLVGCESVTV